MSIKIYPRCKSDWQQIYIDAEGFVFPCCWIANQPHYASYREFHGKDLAQLNTNVKSIVQILNGTEFRKVEDSWATSQPFIGCVSFCASPLPKDEGNLQGTNSLVGIDISKGKLRE